MFNLRQLRPRPPRTMISPMDRGSAESVAQFKAQISMELRKLPRKPVNRITRVTREGHQSGILGRHRPIEHFSLIPMEVTLIRCSPSTQEIVLVLWLK